MSSTGRPGRRGWSGKPLGVRYSADAEARFAAAMGGLRYDDVPHVDGPLVRLPLPDRADGMCASSAALAVDG